MSMNRPRATDRPAPLTVLNAHIAETSQRARQQMASASVPPDASRWPPLRSAERFRETWSRVSAETEVARAEQRAPDNAGPLNSHRLVLHTLGLMRQLSPEYLQAFLAQAETLLWLEHAQSLPKALAGKAVASKVARRKK
ncbi:MAG: DUF2894 domain-containing protein [Hydrogenophaga sp.]|jgi:hypothetical protein|nr:DUF2894 domain-containing protein [Hydrogenophaga sp.]